MDYEIQGNCLTAHYDCLLLVCLKLWIITSAQGLFQLLADVLGPNRHIISGEIRSSALTPLPALLLHSLKDGGRIHTTSVTSTASKDLKEQISQQCIILSQSRQHGEARTKKSLELYMPLLHFLICIRLQSSSCYYFGYVFTCMLGSHIWEQWRSKSACTQTWCFCKVSLQPCWVLMSALTWGNPPSIWTLSKTKAYTQIKQIML